jgi:hypothetical protein
MIWFMQNQTRGTVDEYGKPMIGEPISDHYKDINKLTVHIEQRRPPVFGDILEEQIMESIDTRTPFKSTRKTYNGFVYQRQEQDNFFHVIERWDGSTDLPKELLSPFIYARDVEKAIDTYQARIAEKEKDLFSNLLERVRDGQS